MSTETYKHQPLPAALSRWGYGLLAFAVVMIGIAAMGGHWDRFFAMYHISFLLVTMVGLGALFFVMVEYATGAVWSVPFRRVAENLSLTLPFAAILGIPVLLGAGTIFHWVHPEGDQILMFKEPWLNLGFFAGRYAFYFALWSLFAWLLVRNSRKQDADGDVKWTEKNVRLSSVGLFLVGLTSAFAGMDWLMSLEPHWYSTLMGGHFITTFLSVGVATFALFATYLARQGVLHPVSQNASWLPFGGFNFAFSLLSSYTAFCHVWLIWYGNIPEETVIVLNRWELDGWKCLSWTLIIGGLLAPFFGMLSAKGKRVLWRIRFWAFWMLGVQFLHLVWFVIGSLKDHNTHEAMPFKFLITDLGFVALPIAFILVVFVFLSSRTQMVPVRDPKLERGLHWH